MIVFYCTGTLSFTHLAYLCTLSPIKTRKLEHDLVAFAARYNKFVGFQTDDNFSSITFSPAQLVNGLLSLQGGFAAKYW